MFDPYIDSNAEMKNYFSTADAILFQGGRMPKNPPKRSHAEQACVFVDNEAPLHLHSDGYLFPAWDHVINWTMTYRVDSSGGFRGSSRGSLEPSRGSLEPPSWPKLFYFQGEFQAIFLSLKPLFRNPASDPGL